MKKIAEIQQPHILNVTSQIVKSPVKKPLTKTNIKLIPKKYMTAEQQDANMEDEIDDLLNFTNNLD